MITWDGRLIRLLEAVFTGRDLSLASRYPRRREVTES
jgi:hypothetical protein